MFRYGTTQTKSTPGPQIVIRAFSPSDESVSGEADAIVDTGAVMTCIPQRVVDELGADTLIYYNKFVRGAIGPKSRRKTYIVHLQIAKCSFQNIEVIAFDKEYALIGRDILNGYSITFDGPQGVWRIDKKC